MSTFSSLHFHIVFSTKHRAPLIQSQCESRLHEYMGGVIRGLGGIPECVGGMSDHVHFLVGLKPKHCIADLMRELKKSSSMWARNELKIKDFGWQEGYGVFSISATSIEPVKKYIANQKEHHRQRTYTEEFAGLLDRAGIRYDLKYLE